jgi:prepilin-type N-terminal cleavage/methylation domain-containing protein
MKNNKGISLVEIIIVLAVLSILSVTAFSGINYIKYANSKKCAYKIDSALDRVRMQVMSKANKEYLYIYQYNNDYYMKENTMSTPTATLLDDSGTKLGNKQIKLFYRTTSMSVASPDEEVGSYANRSYIRLSFKKSSGSFITITESGTDYYNEIKIKDRNGTLKYTVTLIQSTGKHYVE